MTNNRRKHTAEFKAKVALEGHSRRVLSWRVSNTLDTSFCVDAVAEALDRFGRPEIFNSDQGAQFTAEDFTKPLRALGIAISMDGKGRCLDNFSSSGCGARSSTRRSTCTPTTTRPKLAPASAAT